MRILSSTATCSAGPARTSTTRAWPRRSCGSGHEVHLLCQDRHPERARLRRRGRRLGRRRAARARPARREPVRRCTVYRPDIGGLLPVYVADRYEGFEARTFAELQRRGARRATSTRTWRRCARSSPRVRPDVALANHLVMGPVILARALGGRACRTPSRSTAARWSTRSSRTPSASCRTRARGSRGARGVLVGSRHTAESLWAAMEDPDAAGAHAPRAAGRRRRSASCRASRARGRGASSRALAARLRATARPRTADAPRIAFARDERRRGARRSARSDPRRATGSSRSSAS